MGELVIIDGGDKAQAVPLEKLSDVQLRDLAVRGSATAASEWARRRTSRATLGGEEGTTE
jgi:hypothetical protein